MIRELTIEDYDRVCYLINQVHEVHLENRPDIYSEGNNCPLAFYENVINNKDNFKYGYIENNNIIGVIIGEKQISKDIPILKQRSVYYIFDIVVDKNLRRNGIGRKLYNYLREKAVLENIDSIELSVWAFNNNAIDFYNDLGMKEKEITMEDIIKK